MSAFRALAEPRMNDANERLPRFKPRDPKLQSLADPVWLR